MQFSKGDSVVMLVRLDAVAYYTGEIVTIDDGAVAIRHATWWRSSGRHHKFMAGRPEKAEYEPYLPETIVEFQIDTVLAIIGPWLGDVTEPYRITMADSIADINQ